MNDQIFNTIVTIVQISILAIMFQLRDSFKKMVATINYNIKTTEPDLSIKIARIVAQVRKEEEGQGSVMTIANLSASDVIKEITNALEILAEDKSKNIKIIISNDKINQGSFEINISYRLDDPV